jgi:Fe-S cluster biosynthesis and repair protein YggX
MSQFIHFGESSRNKMHQIISTCNDYDQGYTNQMMHHAMQHNYHPFTCKWAHDMRLECPTDCAGSGGKSPIKFAWTPLELSEIKLEYRKLILLAPEDDEIIEIALSQILDPMFDGELAWMFLIAPPSWAKTVILVSIHDPKWTELLDSITDKTFFTGKTKVDPKTKEDIPIEGLLPKLNRRTLLIKEFTTILMSGEEQRKSIFGQMRAIYDCHYSQAFGSFDYAKVPETWKHIRMGFFAGCTPYIDKYSVLNAALGERYLKIRMKEPDRLAAIRYARLSSQDKEQKAKQLQKKVKRFIANLKIPERFEQPPDDIANALDYLSEFTVQVRAPVEKEIFAYGNINYEYPDNKELGTRLVQQLVRKGWALTVVCGTDFNEHIYSLLFRIALDTLLPSRKEMVLFLYKRKDAVDDGYIRKTLEWGYKRVENTLTELKHIRVVDNEENSGLYSLNPYIRMCLDKSLLPLHGVHNSLHGGVSPHSLNTYNNKNMRSSSESSELHGKINSDKPFPAKISDNWLSKNQEDVPSCAESS